MRPLPARGHQHWGELHGAAVLHYWAHGHSSTTIRGSTNALLPNGDRAQLQFPVNYRESCRRPIDGRPMVWSLNPDALSDPVEWIWGRMEVADTDIRFIEDPSQQPGLHYFSRADLLTFVADLNASSALRESLRKPDMAANFSLLLEHYAALKGTIRIELGTTDKCHIISILRGYGETAFELECAIDDRIFSCGRSDDHMRVLSEHLFDAGWLIDN